MQLVMMDLASLVAIGFQIGQDIDPSFTFLHKSISLRRDGGIVAIGVPYDYSGNNSGAVRIYENIIGWSQIGQDIYGESAGDESGFSVSPSGNGNTVAVGAPYNDGNGSDAGHVKYIKNIGGSWTK